MKEMNASVPTPHHGDKQTTDKGNLLVCLYVDGSRKFFYLSPDGAYRPHPFTAKTKQFLNKTEWNFLYGKTGKVEKMTSKELEMAEEMFSYIMQDPTLPWKFSDVQKRKATLISIAEKGSTKSFASLPGFADLVRKFG